MSEATTQRALTLTGFAMLLAAVLILLAQAGSLNLSWEWLQPFICLVGGAALLASSADGTVLYAGIAERLASRDPRVPWAFRAAVILTAPLAGLGVVAYAVLGIGQALSGRATAGARVDWRRSVGIGLLGLAVVLAAVAAGLSVGREDLLWSILLSASGLTLFWGSAGAVAARDADDVDDRQLLTYAGFALTIAAAALVLDSTGLFDSAARTIVGTAIAAGVLALVIGPRQLRTSRLLRAERAEKARAQERTELAAHLHDSVLQTLALIQRRSDDSAEVATLARRQERELRSWLNDPDLAQAPERSIATALGAVAAEIEDAHRLEVEVVTVGDRPLGPGSEALLSATREALVNVARHAGGSAASVFLEVKNGRTCVFVRDRGPGFDPASAGDDRRGIRESIVGRMKRAGGFAEVRSKPGSGCEVELSLETER